MTQPLNPLSEGVDAELDRILTSFENTAFFEGTKQPMLTKDEAHFKLKDLIQAEVLAALKEELFWVANEIENDIPANVYDKVTDRLKSLSEGGGDNG
jgi:hypothetical protein